MPSKSFPKKEISPSKSLPKNHKTGLFEYLGWLVMTQGDPHLSATFFPWPMRGTGWQTPMTHEAYSTVRRRMIHGSWELGSHGSWVIRHFEKLHFPHGPWVVRYMSRLHFSHGPWAVRHRTTHGLWVTGFSWAMSRTAPYDTWVMSYWVLMGHEPYDGLSGY